MFKFGVPLNPIAQEYKSPPDRPTPSDTQRERTEEYYLNRIKNENPEAQKALYKSQVERARRRVDNEFEAGFTEYLLGRMGPEREPDEGEPYTRTPGWGERNRSLLGNPEVRDYVLNKQAARDEFERYLTVMKQLSTAIGYDPTTGAYWAPGMFEHYLYYKYILRSPSDDLFSGEAFLKDFQKWKDTREDYSRYFTGVHQYNLDSSYIIQHDGPASMPTSIDQNNATKNSALQEIDPPIPININQGKAPPPTATAPPLPPPLPPLRPKPQPSPVPTAPTKTIKGGVDHLNPGNPPIAAPPDLMTELHKERHEASKAMADEIARLQLPDDEIDELNDLSALIASKQGTMDETEYLIKVIDWFNYIRTTLLVQPKAMRRQFAENYITQFFST